MCPSSGADDCVMLQPRVGMCRGCGNVVKTGWQVVRPWMGVFSFQTGTVAYRFSYKKWTGSTVAVRSTRTWDPIQPRTRQVAVTISIMPDTVHTVMWAPDDGCRYCSEHVEQLADINKTVYFCILLNNFWHILRDARTIEHKRISYFRRGAIDKIQLANDSESSECNSKKSQRFNNWHNTRTLWCILY